MAAVFLSSWWVKAALCTGCVHCLESAGTWSNLYLAVPRSWAAAPGVERAGWDTQRVTLPWQVFLHSLCQWLCGKPEEAAALLLLPPGKLQHVIVTVTVTARVSISAITSLLSPSSFWGIAAHSKKRAHLKDKPKASLKDKPKHPSEKRVGLGWSS